MKICSTIRGLSRCVVLPIINESAEILGLVLDIEANIAQRAGYEEHMPRDRYVEAFDRIKKPWK